MIRTVHVHQPRDPDRSLGADRWLADGLTGHQGAAANIWFGLPVQEKTCYWVPFAVATDLRAALLENRSSVLADLDRRAEAVATARQAVALAERTGSPRLGVIRILLALVYFEAGEWDDALAEAEPAIGVPGTRAMWDVLHGFL